MMDNEDYGYEIEANVLESLLRDLSTCKPQEVDLYIRKAPHEYETQKEADDEDDVNLLGDVTLSSLPPLEMVGKFAVGGHVFAKYYVDGLFYKAVILERSQRAYLVEFVEYGNTQDTYEMDILQEDVALSFAGGDAAGDEATVVQTIVCKACKTECDATLTFCNECGQKLVKQSNEDPEARAARLLLELTPWGQCKGCDSTIMMSDECCLICGLGRGEEKPSNRRETLLRGSKEDGGSSTNAEPTSPRKGLLQKMASRSSVNKDDPSSELDNSKTNKKAKSTAKRETPALPDDQPASPRGLTLKERLFRSKKEDEVVAEPVISSPLQPTDESSSPSQPSSPTGDEKPPSTNNNNNSHPKVKSSAKRDVPPPDEQEKPVSPRSGGLKDKLFASSRSKKEEDQEETPSSPTSSSSPPAAESEAAPRRPTLIDKIRGTPANKDAPPASGGPPMTRTSSEPSKLGALVGKFKSSGKQSSSSSGDGKKSSGSGGIDLGARLRALFGGNPKGADKDKTKPKVQVDTASPQTIEKKSVQAAPETTKTVLADAPASKQQSLGPPPPIPPKPNASNKKVDSAPVAAAPPAPPPKPRAALQLKCHLCRHAVLPGEPIVDMRNAQEGEVYHARCWKCVYCKTALRKFWRIEGAPVCESCYEERNISERLTCSSCKKPVSEYFRVGNAILCPEDYEKHNIANKLKCDVCAASLDRYFSHGGKILCEKDYLETAAKKCDACKKPMQSWYRFQEKDLCEEDYEKERAARAIRCSVCKTAVLQYTEFEGKVYCPNDRPRCCDCKEILSRYVNRDQKYYCLPCAKRAQDAAERAELLAGKDKPVSKFSKKTSHEPSAFEKGKQAFEAPPAAAEAGAAEKKKPAASPAASEDKPSFFEKAKKAVLADIAEMKGKPGASKPAKEAPAKTGLKCSSCLMNADIMAGESYYTVGDKIYCEKHKPSGEKCRGCKKELTGSYVSFDGKSFHDTCFKCADCKSVLGSSFHKRGNNPICGDCASKK